MRALPGLSLLLVSAAARSHDDDSERLHLRPTLERGVLTGQLSQSPHRIAARETLTREQLAERVQRDAERSLRLELDAHPCSPLVEIRELWVPGGATTGDLVTLSCPLESDVQTLRVVSSEPRPLSVTVELGQAGPTPPVLLVGDNASLTVRLREPLPAAYWALGAVLVLGALLGAAGYSRAPRSPSAR
jgi:hypothetical protein